MQIFIYSIHGGYAFIFARETWADYFGSKVAFFQVLLDNVQYKKCVCVSHTSRESLQEKYPLYVWEGNLWYNYIFAFRITSVMQNGWNDGMECQYFLSLSLNKLPSMIYESTPYVTSCYIWISVKCSILAVNWARFIFCLWSLTIPT